MQAPLAISLAIFKQGILHRLYENNGPKNHQLV